MNNYSYVILSVYLHLRSLAYVTVAGEVIAMQLTFCNQCVIHMSA